MAISGLKVHAAHAQFSPKSGNQAASHLYIYCRAPSLGGVTCSEIQGQGENQGWGQQGFGEIARGNLL